MSHLCLFAVSLKNKALSSSLCRTMTGQYLSISLVRPSMSDWFRGPCPDRLCLLYTPMKRVSVVSLWCVSAADSFLNRQPPTSPLCAGAGWRRTSRWQQILFLMFMPKERKTILCMFAWMCMKCGTDIHTPQLPWEVAWFGKSISPGFNLRTSYSGLDQSSFCEELLAAMDVL